MQIAALLMSAAVVAWLLHPRRASERTSSAAVAMSPSTANAPEPSAGSARVSLELLHEVLTRLLENPDSTEPFNLLLADMVSAFSAESGAIFVTTDTGRHPVLLACTERDGRETWARFAMRADHAFSRTEASKTAWEFIANEGPSSSIVALWMAQADYGHGLLLLRVPQPARALTESMPQGLRDYCQYLERIVYSTRRARLKLRHAQSEERAAIARELHDSLAQSLSYLKIQASLLQSMLQGEDRANARAPEVDATLAELRNTLNVAYRQLRELITTFRLTMGGKTFAQALEDSIEEFERRSSIAFDLDNRLPAGELSVGEEMQLLHIVREALANVVRHSHASYCSVGVRLGEDGGVNLTVDDNGTGVVTDQGPERHHGLIIMQERAHTLGGTLSIDARSGGGTRVHVQCPVRSAVRAVHDETA